MHDEATLAGLEAESGFQARVDAGWQGHSQFRGKIDEVSAVHFNLSNTGGYTASCFATLLIIIEYTHTRARCRTIFLIRR